MFILRRHMTFYLAAVGGVAAFVVAWLTHSPLAPVIGANCFFVLYLALTLFSNLIIGRVEAWARRGTPSIREAR